MNRSRNRTAVIPLVLAGLVTGAYPSAAGWVESEFQQAAVSAVAIPDVPGQVSCAQLTSSTVRLSWTAVSLPAGMRYEVRVTDPNGSTSPADTKSTFVSPGTTFDLSAGLLGGLLNNDRLLGVQLRVALTNEAGTAAVWWSLNPLSRTLRYDAHLLTADIRCQL